MFEKKARVLGLFLALSVAAHAAFVYVVYRPVVAAQSSVQHIEVKMIGETLSSSSDEGSPGEPPPEVLATSASAPSASIPMEVDPSSEPETGVQSEAVSQSDVVMLPILRVHEVLSDRVSQAGFAESERLKPLSIDPRYRSAIEVHRRARAQQNLVPVYPQGAYDANRPGRVIVELLINAEGTLDQILVLAATSGFEVSAFEALRDMTFYPAELKGEKVASRMLIEMKYLLVRPSSSKANSDNIMLIGEDEETEK